MSIVHSVRHAYRKVKRLKAKERRNWEADTSGLIKGCGYDLHDSGEPHPWQGCPVCAPEHISAMVAAQFEGRSAQEIVGLPVRARCTMPCRDDEAACGRLATRRVQWDDNAVPNEMTLCTFHSAKILTLIETDPGCTLTSDKATR
jgi:hypothetical protein